MLSHHDFTSAFQAGIETKIAPKGTIGSGARFDVYRNNSLHSRIQALRARFPAVERLVGADFFGMMAHEFLRAHPPRSPVLHEWGAEFPAFLAKFPPIASLPYLPDVARIEIARGRAYHAADCVPIDPEALQSIIAQIAETRLTLADAAQVLTLSQPGHSIWQAQQPNATPRDIIWQPEAVFISRAGMGVITRTISHAEAAFLTALLTAKTCLSAITLATGIDTNFDPIQAFLSLVREDQIINTRLDTQ